MKNGRTLMMVAALLAMATVAQASIYIDVRGEQTFPGNYDSSADRYWNVVASGAAFIQNDLVDEDNITTTVDYNLLDPFQGATGGRTSSALVDWGDPVTADSAYIYAAGDGHAEVRLEGLSTAPGVTYDLSFYGARGLTGGLRRMDVTIGASTVAMNTVIEDLRSLTGISADANGHITIEFDAWSGEYAHLNGIEITQIPEPATMGLVGIMGGALLWVRKRFTI